MISFRLFRGMCFRSTEDDLLVTDRQQNIHHYIHSVVYLTKVQTSSKQDLHRVRSSTIFCQFPVTPLFFNPLKAELNTMCCLLALLGAHHFLHVSRISFKSLTLTLLMSYIYGAPILDVSRSHTTTHHSR